MLERADEQFGLSVLIRVADRYPAQARYTHSVNGVDLAAVLVVLACGYRGYRSGLLGLAIGLVGGVLAVTLAVLLAPLLAPSVSPFISERLGVPSFAVRPLIVVVLATALRFALGFIVGQVAAVVRGILRGIPPLAFADRALGILPMAALGAGFALALVAVGTVSPAGWGIRQSATDSWTARTVLAQPERSLRFAARPALWVARRLPMGPSAEITANSE